MTLREMQSALERQAAHISALERRLEALEEAAVQYVPPLISAADAAVHAGLEVPRRRGRPPKEAA